MDWVDKELAGFWPESKEDRYNFLIELEYDWNVLYHKLFKIYTDKTFHNLFTGNVIHDGNRSMGCVSSYVTDFVKGGDLLSKEGWYAVQGALAYFRQAEILVELYDKTHIN